MKHVPVQVSVSAERHTEGETRLQGSLLRVAQAAWILVGSRFIYSLCSEPSHILYEYSLYALAALAMGYRSLLSKLMHWRHMVFPSQAMPGTVFL